MLIGSRGLFTQRKPTHREMMNSSSNLSRHHLESVFLDSVPELMTTLDLELRIQWANRAAGASVDEDPKNLVGRHCHEVWHGRQSPCEECPVQWTIQTSEARKNEVASPDGRQWLIRSYPLFSSEGYLESVAELTLDITETKRSEKELQKSSDLLNRTQEIAQVGSWELDFVANSLTWSDMVYRIFGFKPQEFPLTYEDFLDRVHPDDRALVDWAYSNSLREGRDSYEVDHRIIRADTGEIRYVHEKCSHERDREGNVVRSVGMVQDLTPRKRAEEDLRLSERNLRQILHSIGDAVITTDMTGYIVQMNPVAEELTACRLWEAQGKKLAEVFRIVESGSRQVCEDPAQKVLLSGEVRGLANDTVLIAQDGREYQIADSAAPIRDDHGEITGVVLVFRDVSEDYTTKRLTEKRLELVEYAASHNLDDFLTKMLDEVGNFVNSPIGFYHFVHPDQKTLTLQQWSTRTLQDFCSVEAKGMHYSIEQAGVWVDCVRSKKPTIHNDYASLPHKQGLPQGHPPVVRELVVPVLREGRIMAFLGIGNKPAEYTEKDQEIVSFFADVTWEIVQQKQAEEKVFDLNLILGSTLDSLSYHLAVLDGQGRIIRVNRAWREFARANGIPARQVSEGTDYLAVCSHAAGENSEGAEAFAEGIRAVISGASDTYRLEYPCHSPDKQRWFIGSVTPFADVAPRRVVVGHEEITERKLAELELRESEEELGAVYDNAPLLMLLVDEDRRIRKANAYAGDFVGEPAEEIQGKRIGQMFNCLHFSEENDDCGHVTPCKQCNLRNIVSETLKTGEGFYRVEVSLSLLLQEGAKEFSFLVSTSLIWHKNKSLILVSFMNITDLKQTEKSLRNSENYYRAIFETSGTAMFIIEEDTTISQVNANFEELSGYSKQEIEGIKSWTEFAHPEDLPWMQEYHYLRRQNPNAALRQYEFRVVNRYGEKTHVLLAVDMIPGTNRSIASAIDIAERKRTEGIIQARLRLMEISLNHSLEDILTATLDEAEQLTNSEIGFYYFLHDDQRTLSLQACSTRTAKICNVSQINGTPYDLENAGVWADCVRRAEPVIHNDYESLPHRRGQPPGHPHILRELVLPVFKEDSIVALLGVGNKRIDYTHADIETVSLLANLAWDIVERKQMEKKLKEMSIYDSLTGLYNRNFFEEEMKRLSDGRYNPLGIIVCDMDGLKFVNDTLGHEAGDDILINAADILRNNFRASDIIARIGGDEFVVLLTDTPPQVMEKIMGKIRQAVQEYNDLEPKVPLSLSMGYAFEEEGAVDMHALFREADNRMYREKIQREGSARNAILQALTSSMEARDLNTEYHCDRIQELSVSFARLLNLSQEVINDLHLLALFHDLGKVDIPDSILFKTGALTEEERQQMRQHCEIGHRIASSVPNLEPIADFILKHHERWDGEGYPLGLSGQDIPLPCRILAIVDAYDAMISEGPYRRAMTRENAIAELERCAGTQFDPDLVEKFVIMVQDFDNC